MCDKGKEWSQKTIHDGHNMTIVRLTFFGCKLLFTTRNFVFGMNNVVAEYQISSSVVLKLRRFATYVFPLFSFSNLDVWILSSIRECLYFFIFLMLSSANIQKDSNLYYLSTKIILLPSLLAGNYPYVLAEKILLL